MIDLQKYKTQRLEKFNQLILLDLSGNVIQSCNAIFDTSDYKTKSIKNEIPLLESIFDVTLTHIPGTPDILFSKIEKPFKLLPGFYDFTFSKLIIDNQAYILWSIYDFTALYKDLIDYQQRYNELEIRKQLDNSLLRMDTKEQKNQDYFESMVSALKMPKEEVNQLFQVENSIKSVFDAFRYKTDITFQSFENSVKEAIYGDVTWFKFLLYNLLDNVISIYDKVGVQLKVNSNKVLEKNYLNLTFTLVGRMLYPNLFAMIFEEQPLRKADLNAKERALLSRLYGVQKIANQQNGYLQLTKMESSIQHLQSTLVFNFQVQINQL